MNGRLGEIAGPVGFSHVLESGETATATVDVPPPIESVSDLVAKLNANTEFSAAFTATVGTHTYADGQTAAANLIIMAKTPGAGAVTTTGIPSDEAQLQQNPGRDEVPERVGGYGSVDILGVVDVTREAGSSTHTYTTGGGASRGFGTANDGVTPPREVTVTNTWRAGATDAITQIDRAIEIVSRGRAEMGATENGLEHTSRSLGVSAENLAMSQSRIRDADLAKEISEMQKWQIMSQAAMQMLAQANQVPQTVLKLLQ